MVKNATLQKFIDAGGYDLVTHIDDGTKDGSWKGVEEASRKSHIHRMTIWRLLKKNPTAPPKGEAKYVSEFEDDEGFKKFKLKYGNLSQFKSHRKTLRDAWLLLDKKDSSTWEEADWWKIWKSEKFVHPKIKDIPETFATAFHNLMRATGKTNFLLIFKGAKFAKGSKKDWFMEAEDIKKLVAKYEKVDMIIVTALGIAKGARISSLILCKPEKLDVHNNYMSDFEPKMSRHGRNPYVRRYLSPRLVKLLVRYIEDYHIQPTDLMFARGYSYYYDRMVKAGQDAGLTKRISTHIMKHTFVTQAMHHKCGADVVSQQTGTDFTTLSQSYAAESEQMARAQLLGEKYEVEPFYEWYENLMESFESNYDRIRKTET